MARRIEAVAERARLPVWGPRLGVERYVELMSHDKKVEGGEMRLVLHATRSAAR